MISKLRVRIAKVVLALESKAPEALSITVFFGENILMCSATLNGHLLITTLPEASHSIISVRCAFPLLCEANLMVTVCEYNSRAFSNCCFSFPQFHPHAFACNFQG